MPILVVLGLLFACKKETTNDLDRRLDIPKAGYPVTVEASGSEKVDALVRELVSRRPAPYHSGAADSPLAVVASNRYSTPEVEAAIKSLKQMGPPIFPLLVKNFRDDRYSYSDIVAAWENQTVGSAILEIFDDGHYMHSGYKFRKTPRNTGGGYFSFAQYLNTRGVEAWAEWASHKSRLEIQLDFIDWCIEQENQTGYVDEAQKKQILETYEKAREEVKKEYSQPAKSPSGNQSNR